LRSRARCRLRRVRRVDAQALSRDNNFNPVRVIAVLRVSVTHDYGSTGNRALEPYGARLGGALDLYSF